MNTALLVITILSSLLICFLSSKKMRQYLKENGSSRHGLSFPWLIDIMVEYCHLTKEKNGKTGTWVKVFAISLLMGSITAISILLAR